MKTRGPCRKEGDYFTVSLVTICSQVKFFIIVPRGLGAHFPRSLTYNRKHNEARLHAYEAQR